MNKFDDLMTGLRLAQHESESKLAYDALDFAIEWFSANEDDVREWMDDPEEENQDD